MQNFPAILQKITEKISLTSAEMCDAMQAILQGELTNAQLAAFLIAMRMKGETVNELTAAAKVMRELATPVDVRVKNVIDIVGTGGDQAQLFNISTASALVIAAAGGFVAKHGNRSVSSKSGSADVLEAAGVNLNLTPQQIADGIKKIGVGFLFAPLHHTAMKHVASVRKELGARTFFNLLGPLTNPANVKQQVVGVYSKQWLTPIAEVLQQLGSEHVMVLHAEDGLDEISIAAPTLVAELKAGVITHYTITPEQFGLTSSTLDPLKVSNANESLEIIKHVLENKPGAAHDIVALNAGAGIYVAGLSNHLADGINLAKQVIADGKAALKLKQLIEFSRNI
jgi:anthranilate phosphoribosyltransferase